MRAWFGIGLGVVLSLGAPVRAGALALLEVDSRSVSIDSVVQCQGILCTSTHYAGESVPSPGGGAFDAEVSAPDPSMGSVVQHSTVDVTPLDPGLVLAQNFVLGSIEGSGSATSLVATYPQPANLQSMLGVGFSVDRDTRVFLSGELFLTAPGGTPEGVGTVALSDASPCSGSCPSPLFYLTFANPAPTSGNPGSEFVQPFSYDGTLAPGTYQLLVDALVSPPNDSGASDSQTAGWSVSFAVPEPGSAGLLLIALLPLALRGVRAAARRS